MSGAALLHANRKAERALGQSEVRMRLLNVAVAAFAATTIVSLFQFTLEASTLLYCDRRSYTNDADGQALCQLECTAALPGNGSAAGLPHHCTKVEERSLYMFYGYAALLALDTAHNIIAAFGNMWPYCTERRYETSCRTYTFKGLTWMAAVAFGSLSIVLYLNFSDQNTLVVMAAGGFTYLFASVLLMVGRARLKHAQMRLRANVQIDYELRRLADVEMHRRGRGANQKRNLHLSASLLGESTSSQVLGADAASSPGKLASPGHPRQGKTRTEAKIDDYSAVMSKAVAPRGYNALALYNSLTQQHSPINMARPDSLQAFERELSPQVSREDRNRMRQMQGQQRQMQMQALMRSQVNSSGVPGNRRVFRDDAWNVGY